MIFHPISFILQKEKMHIDDNAESVPCVAL